MLYFYYVHRLEGMTSNGSFTRIKANWLRFTQEDVNKLGDTKPYGATRQGWFVEMSKYQVKNY